MNVASTQRHPGPVTSPDARTPDAGVGRVAGISIAAVTAALVFLAGRALLPMSGGPNTSSGPTREAPGPASQTPPPPTPPPSPDAAATEGGECWGRDLAESAPEASGDLGALGTDASDAGANGPALAVAPAPPKTDSPAQARPAPDALTDKDIARAAWRANWPEVQVSGPRASIVIPLKGSAAGSFYRFFPKTKVVAIVLPHAASLNTMHYYRLAHDGFRALWTFQDESNANPKDGTKLRLKLDAPTPPQVDIFDDFVRVTIRNPNASD